MRRKKNTVASGRRGETHLEAAERSALGGTLVVFHEDGQRVDRLELGELQRQRRTLARELERLRRRQVLGVVEIHVHLVDEELDLRWGGAVGGARELDGVQLVKLTQLDREQQLESERRAMQGEA